MTPELDALVQTGHCRVYSMGDNKGPSKFRKILVSVKFSGAGNGCANFMGAWKNAFFLQEKPMSIKFLFWGGGGRCRFYFYGREDFSDKIEKRQLKNRICTPPPQENGGNSGKFADSWVAANSLAFFPYFSGGSKSYFSAIFSLLWPADLPILFLWARGFC